MVRRSVVPNSQLKIMGHEFLTSFDRYEYNEFRVELLFDRSILIYRPMRTHLGIVNRFMFYFYEVTIGGTLYQFAVILIGR